MLGCYDFMLVFLFVVPQPSSLEPLREKTDEKEQ